MPEVACNRRILIIDDNPAIHEDFRKILCGDFPSAQDLAGAAAALFGETPETVDTPAFEVDSAFQGREGLERVIAALKQGKPYATTFLDVRMPPGWDGIETAERLWAHDPDLQIVLCTAYSDYSWDQVRARLGRSDRLLILKKPFDNVEALQLADALTEKWRLSQQVRVQVADLERLIEFRTQALRATNAELCATNERYRLLMENTSALPWELDSKTWQPLYLGPQIFATLDIACDTGTMPNLFLELLHPEDREPFKRFVTGAARGLAKEGHIDSRLPTALGEFKYLRSFVAAQRGASEGGTFCGISIDVTQQKQLELELAQAQKLEAVGRLAAGVAHEINTPLQFISDNVTFMRTSMSDIAAVVQTYRGLQQAVQSAGDISAAARGAAAAETRADLDYILENAPAAMDSAINGLGRITTIVRSMKEFAHPDQAGKTFADLNQAIQGILIIAENEYKGVAEIETDFGELPPVQCYLGEINQVVLKLLVNAAHSIADVVKETGTLGKLKLRTRLDGNEVEITISDTGTGIPEAVRGKIFDPFFTTKDVGKGTGQGLAIAHRVIANKHKGILRFETECGEGTTFFIRLPVAASEEPDIYQAAS